MSKIDMKVGRNFSNRCNPITDRVWSCHWLGIWARKLCAYQNVENKVEWTARPGNIGGRARTSSRQTSGDGRFLQGWDYLTNCGTRPCGTSSIHGVPSLCQGGGDGYVSVPESKRNKDTQISSINASYKPRFTVFQSLFSYKNAHNRLGLLQGDPFPPYEHKAENESVAKFFHLLPNQYTKIGTGERKTR
jgi:hypothetical protein